MSTRLLDAVLAGVAPSGAGDPPAVLLTFRTTATRVPLPELGRELVDRADLGPALTLESATAIGRILRLLRAARVAAPRDARVLLGDPERAVALLRRAVGAPVVLEVRTRSTVRFTAWTDEGVEEVDQVAEVVEDASAFLVRRRGGRLPVRVPRDRVVRRETRRERWLEIVGIDRPAPG